MASRAPSGDPVLCLGVLPSGSGEPMSTLSPLDTSRIRAEVVRIARKNLGYGEHNRNFLGLLRAPVKAEWCAYFASYCYSKAYTNLGFGVPTWAYRKLNRPEPGAKRLVKNLGKVGSTWLNNPTDTGYEPLPGDLVCWHRRTGLLSWTGHVGIVTETNLSSGFRSIEGNVGGKVVERFHLYTEPKLYRFASLEP